MSDTQLDLLNFELYDPGETWSHGSKALECDQFRDHARRVSEVQKYLATKSDGTFRRVFHAKSHGCLFGRLDLLPGRPLETRHGIFREGARDSYPVLARFSNGKGVIDSDWKPDVRGVALKVFKVSEPDRTMDLLMTNSPVAFGRDHAEFVAFMEASKDGMPPLSFALEHRRVAVSLARCVLPPLSVTALTFWTGHAYLLGPTRAMKMNIRPDERHESILERAADTVHLFDDPDYLAHDLGARAASNKITYTVSVQLEAGDRKLTPIEDSLTEWTEEASPSIPVAELVFEPQSMTKGQMEYVDELSFTPGNYLLDHRPLGNLARGRLFSYLASQKGRVAKPTLSYAEFTSEWERRRAGVA